ncbi:MAG: hypothetical protein L3J67_05655 [Hyphomicrobiaceae bacterium]|nr:hypothetical protein [Hyphomicrobiaceae bacterium]
MYLIETAAFVLSILLLHSLLGKLGAFRALFMLKVHAIALRELTAIHRRADLVAKFGPHDDVYKFAVTLGQIMAARPLWRWIFGNIGLEAMLIYALLSMVFGNIAPDPWLAGGAALYYAVTHFLLIRGFSIVRPEIEEEIRHGETARRARLDRLAKERFEREGK